MGRLRGRFSLDDKVCSRVSPEEDGSFSNDVYDLTPSRASIS
jgi:hypothetical protein